MSCVDATDCDAVGDGSFGAALGAHFDGSAWTAADVTSFPSGTLSSHLDSISCSPIVIPGHCTAGGSQQPAAGAINPALERLNGATWTDQAFQNEPPAPTSSFSGLTCHGPRGCVAVGEWDDNTPAGHPLIESASGSTWGLEAIPALAANVTDATLASTACIATDPCFAVGEKTLSSTDTKPLVEEAHTGTTWGDVPVSLPPTATGGQLFGVSCGSTGASNTCATVGSMATSAGTLPLAEVWNGSVWTFSTPPVPAGTNHAVLLGISCPTATSCAAVGVLLPSHSASEVPLVDTWNGHSWSLGSPAIPAGTSYSGLRSVSCPTVTSCTAIGFAERGNQTLVEQWNASSWRIRPVTLLTGEVAGGLSGVTCSSSVHCVAVGTGRGGDGVSHALTVVGNGTAWTSQPAVDPPGELQGLLAVDCLSSTNCTAVGGYRNVTGQVVTLAERFH